jgi:hypothetical protein
LTAADKGEAEAKRMFGEWDAEVAKRITATLGRRVGCGERENAPVSTAKSLRGLLARSRSGGAEHVVRRQGPPDPL